MATATGGGTAAGYTFYNYMRRADPADVPGFVESLTFYENMPGDVAPSGNAEPYLRILKGAWESLHATLGLGPVDAGALAGKVRVERMDPEMNVAQVEGSRVAHLILSNGLHVVYTDIPGIFPEMYLKYVYNVGSHAEADGEAGMAHFIEHMVFKGVFTPAQAMKWRRRIALGESDINELVKLFGAGTNAWTNDVATTYHFEAMREHVPKFLQVLALEAENVMFDPDHMAREVEAVIKEMELGLASAPRQRYARALTALYGAESPYGRTTIGDVRDLKALRSDTLTKFYERYYNPSNAVLYVTGNFGAFLGNYLLHAVRMFGPIPNREGAARAPTVAVPRPLSAAAPEALDVKFPVQGDAASYTRLWRFDEAALKSILYAPRGAADATAYPPAYETELRREHMTQAVQTVFTGSSGAIATRLVAEALGAGEVDTTSFSVPGIAAVGFTVALAGYSETTDRQAAAVVRQALDYYRARVSATAEGGDQRERPYYQGLLDTARGEADAQIRSRLQDPQSYTESVVFAYVTAHPRVGTGPEEKTAAVLAAHPRRSDARRHQTLEVVDRFVDAAWAALVDRSAPTVTLTGVPTAGIAGAAAAAATSVEVATKVHPSMAHGDRRRVEAWTGNTETPIDPHGPQYPSGPSVIKPTHEEVRVAMAAEQKTIYATHNDYVARLLKERVEPRPLDPVTADLVAVWGAREADPKAAAEGAIAQAAPAGRGTPGHPRTVGDLTEHLLLPLAAGTGRAVKVYEVAAPAYRDGRVRVNVARVGAADLGGMFGGQLIDLLRRAQRTHHAHHRALYHDSLCSVYSHAGGLAVDFNVGLDYAPPAERTAALKSCLAEALRYELGPLDDFDTPAGFEAAFGVTQAQWQSEVTRAAAAYAAPTYEMEAGAVRAEATLHPDRRDTPAVDRRTLAAPDQHALLVRAAGDEGPAMLAAAFRRWNVDTAVTFMVGSSVVETAAHRQAVLEVLGRVPYWRDLFAPGRVAPAPASPPAYRKAVKALATNLNDIMVEREVPTASSPSVAVYVYGMMPYNPPPDGRAWSRHRLTMGLLTGLFFRGLASRIFQVREESGAFYSARGDFRALAAGGKDLVMVGTHTDAVRADEVLAAFLEILVAPESATPNKLYGMGHVPMDHSPVNAAADMAPPNTLEYKVGNALVDKMADTVKCEHGRRLTIAELSRMFRQLRAQAGQYEYSAAQRFGMYASLVPDFIHATYPDPDVPRELDIRAHYGHLAKQLGDTLDAYNQMAGACAPHCVQLTADEALGDHPYYKTLNALTRLPLAALRGLVVYSKGNLPRRGLAVTKGV
jgi:predicted Zn-dependent peptidase